MDVMMIFNVVLMILGVCMAVSAFNMKKSKQIGMILAEEEVYKCKDTVGFIESVYRRQIVLGIALVVYGGVGLLDKFVLKIGGRFPVRQFYEEVPWFFPPPYFSFTFWC